MWAILLFLAVFLYLLIPKDTVEERRSHEDFVDATLLLSDDDYDEDMLIEELMFLWDEEDEDDDFCN